MVRNGRGKNKAETLDSHLIPEDHTCLSCFKKKDEVNFYVTINRKSKSVCVICNMCRKKGIRVSKFKGKSKKMVEFSYEPEPIRFNIKHQIDFYFQDLEKEKREL